MSTLQQRTTRRFYDELAAHAARAGMPADAISSMISDMMREAQELLAGRCPKCGEPARRYVDYGRQQGPKAMPGAWVMWRCSTAPPPGQRRPDGACDFMLDLVEAEAAC